MLELTLLSSSRAHFTGNFLPKQWRVARHGAQHSTERNSTFFKDLMIIAVLFHVLERLYIKME